MNRLVVNPGTSQAWEIQLKPGVNSLGRNDTNDFQLDDSSVSGSHCQIVVSDGGVFIKDLGSTNGTFINQTAVREVGLQSGQRIKLGNLEMEFIAEGAPASIQVPVAPIPIPVPVSAAVPPPAGTPPAPRLRVHAVAAPAAPPPPLPASPGAPVAPPPVPAAQAASDGPKYCRYHPKSPARYLCNKCNRTFCEMCVNSRNAGDRPVVTCRSCGVECVPLEFEDAESESFYSKLPRAFAYPFKDTGVIILICASLLVGGLNFISFFCFGIFIQIALYGFLFLYMQNIVLTTTSNESEPLGLPDASNIWMAALQLAGTVLISFFPVIALVIARYQFIQVPVEAIVAAVVVGGIYFPMALLAVSMTDSVASANPLVVIPSMMRVPKKYLITVILLLAVFGFLRSGGVVAGMLGLVQFKTHKIGLLLFAIGFLVVWTFVSVYLMTVTMRILGLFYNDSKTELGWFVR